MKIVIDIPRGLFLDFDMQQWTALSCLDMRDALRKGTILPEGHGRLIDAEAFERRCMFDDNIEDMQDVIYALRDYDAIIEADRREE